MEINKDMLTSFGKYGVIIMDNNSFCNRINQALLTLKGIKKAECGFVNYISEDDSKGIIDFNPFIKLSNGYSYQNEFRFCFEKDSEDALDFFIGSSIKDIAFPINTELFLKTLKYNEDGYVIFEDMM